MRGDGSAIGIYQKVALLEASSPGMAAIYFAFLLFLASLAIIFDRQRIARPYLSSYPSPSTIFLPPLSRSS